LELAIILKRAKKGGERRCKREEWKEGDKQTRRAWGRSGQSENGQESGLKCIYIHIKIQGHAHQCAYNYI